MTSMKGAPAPMFSSTVISLLVKSVRDACDGFDMKVIDETPAVRRTMFINGDYLAGIRVTGASFQGTVTLAMDKRLAKFFADKLFADAPAKTDDAMLCDLVGEVCNQITGQIQRGFGQLGCKMQVSAQEISQSRATLDFGTSPDEWLLVPFKYDDGVGVLSFGYTGELGIGQDDVQDDLSDARTITFF